VSLGEVKEKKNNCAELDQPGTTFAVLGSSFEVTATRFAYSRNAWLVVTLRNDHR
jgi:hypothetical protein